MAINWQEFYKNKEQSSGTTNFRGTGNIDWSSFYGERKKKEDERKKVIDERRKKLRSEYLKTIQPTIKPGVKIGEGEIRPLTKEQKRESTLGKVAQQISSFLSGVWEYKEKEKEKVGAAKARRLETETAYKLGEMAGFFIPGYKWTGPVAAVAESIEDKDISKAIGGLGQAGLMALGGKLKTKTPTHKFKMPFAQVAREVGISSLKNVPSNAALGAGYSVFDELKKGRTDSLWESAVTGAKFGAVIGSAFDIVGGLGSNYLKPEYQLNQAKQLGYDEAGVVKSRNVLGVKNNATINEIEKAYYKLSKKYHPDMPTGDIKKFQQISNAYSYLTRFNNAIQPETGVKIINSSRQQAEKAAFNEATKGLTTTQKLDVASRVTPTQPKPIAITGKVKLPSGKVKTEPKIIAYDIKDLDRTVTDVNQAYEAQKDLWFGKTDTRLHNTRNEAIKLQSEIKQSLGKKKYDIVSKDYDEAIQIYLDLKRSPGDIDKYYNKLSDGQKKIVDLSQNLPEELRTIADKISQSYKDIGLESLESDVIKNTLDNYVSRIWNIEDKPGSQEFRKFGVTSRHAKERKFSTILEGWANGYDTRIKGSTNNLKIYKEELIKTIEDKRFLNTLKKLKDVNGNPILSTKQLEGYKRIEHPNFKVWRPTGKIEKGKVYGKAKNIFLGDDNNVYEKQELYAPKDIAKNMNNILGVSKLKGIKAVDALTKGNALLKSMILQTSFFHHFAGVRSYYGGGAIKSFEDMNVAQAYKEGYNMSINSHPLVMQGVRNGLTLGAIQDWDEQLINEDNFVDKILAKNKITGGMKDKIKALQKSHSDFLFGEFFTGLKAKAYTMEFNSLAKKYPNKDADEISRMAANLVNDDFGGLHLKRMGRNPTVQHIFRLVALAPDWTESNIRSMIKAFKAGGEEEQKMYRTFWARIFARFGMATVLSNALMAAVDEDDDETKGAIARFIRNYKKAYNEKGVLGLMETDITPIYKMIGGQTDRRKYFSIFGHFKDPVKFLLHPGKSAKYKASVFAGMFLDAMSGTDWAQRRYTNYRELLGMDYEKGEYKTTKKGKYKKGDPKYGRLKWQTVTPTLGVKGPVTYDRLLSFLINQVKGVLPVQVQNYFSWQSGELNGFDAIMNSIGAGVGTTYEEDEE